MGEYLSTDTVCRTLAEAGVDEVQVGRIFAARLRPDGIDPEKKFVLGAKTPDGRVYLVVTRCGTGQPLVRNTPLDENGPDWRPRFLSVEGPFTLEEAPGRAKELTQ